MISTWICRFRMPYRITLHQGRQCESQLFLSLDKYFVFQISRTTADYPQSNDLQHRTIKSSLKCHLQKNKSWVDVLSFVLLGLRLLL
ncbi:hypothetical protein CEXT_257291 [Caerostris extrusa]|uniref:Uncharacterized protein n=1 Tax=Caerostris extrusa TaxID=172846 RepID=A0AAV4RKD5_CAEEX|nr:hypothetical protein CEXT_257291 [Caerostris extrusa]